MVEVPVEKVIEVEKVVEKIVEVPTPVDVSRCELPDMTAAGKFVVEAWAIPDPEFNVGEPLRLQTRTSAASYLSIFHVSTSCKVIRLLHNAAMRPTEIVDFPNGGGGLRITVKPPAGREGFYLIATREPLEFLSGTDILREAVGIAVLDLSPSQLYQRLADVRGRINPDDWSMTTLHTRVVGH